MWPRNIRPYVGAQSDREPFSEWWPRVRHHIESVPENVAAHWLHRHFGASPYEFLPLHRLRFERCVWSLEQLKEVKFGFNWGSRLDSPGICETPLAEMMIAAGTWPEPILILDNPDGLTENGGAQMGRWHLIEGHRRLTYLRFLTHKGAARPEHDVWIVRVAQASSEDVEASLTTRASLSPAYIWQKLFGAVESLAIEDGPIQQRLREACRGELLHLTKDAFPAEQRELWAELMEALTRGKLPGSLAATIESMGTREASHHARTILELYEWTWRARVALAEQSSAKKVEPSNTTAVEYDVDAILRTLDEHGRACLREVQNQIEAAKADGRLA